LVFEHQESSKLIKSILRVKSVERGSLVFLIFAEAQVLIVLLDPREEQFLPRSSGLANFLRIERLLSFLNEHLIRSFVELFPFSFLIIFHTRLGLGLGERDVKVSRVA